MMNGVGYAIFKVLILKRIKIVLKHLEGVSNWFHLESKPSNLDNNELEAPTCESVSD